ncbi:MAG: esterase [Burkholderiaceae bacterium]|nr:MAG: esterase [Burkholderiaceae bacterium]
MILYLHGFRSSPRSSKAQQCAQALAAMGRGAEFICPQLSAEPAQAWQQCLDLIAVYGTPQAVIGSSLGGFYATLVAEHTGCRAVPLNPAVLPERDLANEVGELTYFHTQEKFVFRREYLAQLHAMSPATITRPERYLLIAATGDEVLDWREMVARYAGATHIIIEGSNHSLDDFADYLPRVLEFCGAPGERFDAQTS